MFEDQTPPPEKKGDFLSNLLGDHGRLSGLLTSGRRSHLQKQHEGRLMLAKGNPLGVLGLLSSSSTPLLWSHRRSDTIYPLLNKPFGSGQLTDARPTVPSDRPVSRTVLVEVPGRRERLELPRKRLCLRGFTL